MPKTDYASLLQNATLAVSSKGGGTRSTQAKITFESDSNGRPRISISTAQKRIFIKDGTFSRYVQILFLDQRDPKNRSKGKILVFFTFCDSDDGNNAVSISNSVDSSGEITRKNISYINSLSSLCTSVDIKPQELYSTTTEKNIERIKESNSYVITIPAKEESELEKLIQEDERRVSEHKARLAAKELDSPDSEDS